MKRPLQNFDAQADNNIVAFLNLLFLSLPFGGRFGGGFKLSTYENIRQITVGQFIGYRHLCRNDGAGRARTELSLSGTQTHS